MRPPIRALVFLFWIYAFVANAVGVFMQIYVYQLFNSVPLNIVAAMISLTGLMLGFCGYGMLASRYRLNAKHGFLFSFACTGLGLVLLSGAHDVLRAYLALSVAGIGSGFFWLTIHTYELIETRDHERDVYSTFLSAGDQVISLAGPAFATVLIWISQMYGWGEFMLLFIATPLIFLLGFLFFGTLSDYRPAPLRRHDLDHFFTDHRNQVAQVYLMGGAAMNLFQQAILPLVAITVLGTALNVGGFNTVFAVVGVLVLLVVGAYRHPKNRLLILGITSAALALLNVMLGLSITLIVYIAYMIGTSVAQPLMRVSQHVIDLQIMDGAGHRESDFYPTMIFRDISLWVWRMLAGLVLLVAVSVAGTDREAISIGVYFIAGAFVVIYIGARLLLAHQPKANLDTNNS